jgi:hypothetical protein
MGEGGVLGGGGGVYKTEIGLFSKGDSSHRTLLLPQVPVIFQKKDCVEG